MIAGNRGDSRPKFMIVSALRRPSSTIMKLVTRHTGDTPKIASPTS
jgi:hypothetical protein